MVGRDQGTITGRVVRRLADDGAELALDLKQCRKPGKEGRNIFLSQKEQTQCGLYATQGRAENKKRDLGRNFIPCYLILLSWLT